MTAVEDRTETPAPTADAAEGPDLALLFGELRAESRLLMQHELDLAKAEMNEARQHLTTGAIGVAAAGVLAVLAAVLLSAAAAWGIAEALPTWLAFLIVGGAWALLAVIAAIVGRSALRRFDPVPRRTITTIKEDARWLRTLTS